MNLPGRGAPVRGVPGVGVLSLRLVLQVEHQPAAQPDPVAFDGLLQRGGGPIDAAVLEGGPPPRRHLRDYPPNLAGVARAQDELDVRVAVRRGAALAVPL